MSNERRLEVLRAIVQDYVDTNEPVGSKTIVDRHQFGVSAATIRNDMALLREALAQETTRLNEAAENAGRTARRLTENLGRERDQMQATIDDLRARLDRSEDRVSGLLTAPKRARWWPWGRG